MIRVYQVFESYPLFYQPYIPPVLKELAKIKGLESKIIAYNGDSVQESEVFILPNYYFRKIYEKFNKTFFKKYKNLSFLEIKSLKDDVDIIHVQHSFLFSKVLGLLKLDKSKRAKIVITLRGGDTYIKPWISKRWKKFYEEYGPQVDAFIVMSEDQKKYLTRWGVPLDHIYVIPISFGDKFKIEPKYPNKNELKLVSVFRMCWEKDIADNLRLVKQLKEFGIKVQYDVYGDGPDLGQLYYLRDKFDLVKEVNILGKVANKILKSELSRYDFLLQLSHSESLGMSVIEAQTRGLPAIVSNVGGLPEIINNNHNGIILKDLSVKELQRISDLWRNRDLYYEYSKASINLSQSRYNINVESSKLLNLYDSLI
jgi:glycosyltransferase involved in cell wall biosynthesis